MKNTAQLEPSIGEAQVGEDDAGAFSRSDTAAVVHVRSFLVHNFSVKASDGAAQTRDFDFAVAVWYDCDVFLRKSIRSYSRIQRRTSAAQLKSQWDNVTFSRCQEIHTHLPNSVY